MFLDQQITSYGNWKREKNNVQSLNLIAAGTHYQIALDNLVDNTVPIGYNIILNIWHKMRHKNKVEREYVLLVFRFTVTSGKLSLITHYCIQ